MCCRASCLDSACNLDLTSDGVNSAAAVTRQGDNPHPSRDKGDPAQDGAPAKEPARCRRYQGRYRSKGNCKSKGKAASSRRTPKNLMLAGARQVEAPPCQNQRPQVSLRKMRA